MDKEKQKEILQIAGVIVLALFLLLPVMWYANRANSPQKAITAEQLKSFQDDTLEYVEHNGPTFADFDEGNIGNQGPRGKWRNTGGEIASVNINTLVNMSPEDLQTVGATPFSIMNTVMTNLNTTPQVIEIIFDNADVIKGFSGRKSVKDLTKDHLAIYNMVSSQDMAVDNFVNSPAVQGVLKNERLLRSLLKSKLFAYLFNTPAAKYYIANPDKARQLIQSNNTLAPYLKNQSLKKVLLEIPATRKASAQVFR